MELDLPFFLSNLIPLLEKKDVNGNIVNTTWIVTGQIWKILWTSVAKSQKIARYCKDGIGTATEDIKSETLFYHIYFMKIFVYIEVSK